MHESCPGPNSVDELFSVGNSSLSETGFRRTEDAGSVDEGRRRAQKHLLGNPTVSQLVVCWSRRGKGPGVTLFTTVRESSTRHVSVELECTVRATSLLEVGAPSSLRRGPQEVFRVR